MERDLVTTDKDHLCGRCRKLIPAGSNALKGKGKMFDGRGNSITIQVFYHPDCPPFRAKQVREIPKRKGRRRGGRRGRKKKQWQNQS